MDTETQCSEMMNTEGLAAVWETNQPRPKAVRSWSDLMKRGDWAAAWRVADESVALRAGRPCWHRPRHEQYVWDGAPLDGKRVLVRCYHGLGDTVQFIRFAPWLKALAAEVVVWAQPALLPLLRGVEDIDRLSPLHDGTPDVCYDADVEVMELAHVFRAEPNRLPREVPYLRAPGRRVRLPGKRWNVGVIWRAGEWDERRSIPIEELAPLADVPGVTLHAMQHGAAREAWPASWGPVCPAANPEETARWMDAMDLVVSVDSFPAHLAGALGRPVWTLLPKEADWRWMEGREDSPWYPTMRLFRQKRSGDWTSVIDQAARSLRLLGKTGRRADAVASDAPCGCFA